MNPSNRRVFLMTLAAGTSTLAAGAAMAQAKLDEKDPTAVALGYVADSAKADKKKYPKHDVAQKCSNCTLFQGKAGAAEGACPLFPGKVVAANGWCASWVKKA
jgi:High potential iron-sulfur protein